MLRITPQIVLEDVLSQRFHTLMPFEVLLHLCFSNNKAEASFNYKIEPLLEFWQLLLHLEIELRRLSPRSIGHFLHAYHCRPGWTHCGHSDRSWPNRYSPLLVPPQTDRFWGQSGDNFSQYAHRPQICRRTPLS